MWQTDFGDHAAEVRIRVAKLAHQVDHLAIV
jgi:hypothetical protein